MTSVTVPASVEYVRPEGSAALILLHLVPGVAALVAYVGFASIMAVNSWPNILALASASVLVEAPTAWAVMIVRERAAGRPLRFRSLFPWNQRLRWTTYAFVGIPVALFSLVVIAALSPVAESALLDTLFPWIPQWFVLRSDPAALVSISRGVLLGVWAMTFLMALVGGGTQELYFRGYLLPRMRHLGPKAALLNAAGFAVFHLIAPWSWGVFFLVALPWSLVTWWKRSVRLALFAHVAMLLLQWAGLTALVFGLVSIPG